MRSAQHFYLSRLDHLRFFAAALVVMFHYVHTRLPDMRSGNPLVSLVDEGHTGIALFMVISGFIFTAIAADRDINYAGFMRNRVLRIYPLFVFAVFLQLLISTYNDHRNYGFQQLIGWLVPFRSDTVPLSPHFVQLWTIWVEFQFYLLFPFLLAFSRRRGATYLWGLLALLLVVRGLVYAATGSVRFLAYETIFGRLDQFLVGMLLARVWVSRERANTHASGGDGGALPMATTGAYATAGLHPAWLVLAALVAVLGVHLFSLGVGFSELISPFWIVWPPIEAALWAGVLWTYLQARGIGPQVWRQRFDRTLAALGAISFSIYVMHNLVIAAIRGGWARLQALPPEAALSPYLVGALVVLPAVLLMATLTYHLIERPFLEWRRPYTRDASAAA